MDTRQRMVRLVQERLFRTCVVFLAWLRGREASACAEDVLDLLLILSIPVVVGAEEGRD